MSGFGIQKRGTGRAVKKMSLGGALAIKSEAYKGKPGSYEQSYYTQALPVPRFWIPKPDILLLIYK